MMFQRATFNLAWAAASATLLLTGCADNMIRKESPARAYKDYTYENRNNAAVLGVGEPMSSRQMRADATFNLKGTFDLEGVMKHIATTYNVAIRWGNGVRQGKRKEVLINNLSFDEARAYIEDVYDIQVIREGERRLLVLPSASETRLGEFNPGANVSLAKALTGLADQCGYNLVITESRDTLASTMVSTRLKDVSCYDAFEALLNPHSLSLINAGDYYTVGGLPQRQWSVNLYEPERTEEISVKYSSDIASSGDEEGGSTGSAGGSSNVKIKYERNLWTDLQTDLEELITSNCPQGGTGAMPAAESAALLPPPDGTGTNTNSQLLTPTNTAAPATATSSESGETSTCGYVRINKNVGLIQMRAPRSVLEEANNIITRTEEIATRRIMLEARVMAVSKNRDYNQDARLMGIQGDKTFGFNDNKTAMSGQLASPGNAPAASGAPATSIATTLAEFLNSSGGSGSASAGAGSGGFLGVANRSLQAAVQFLESFGTTYELMHPRIELMDRQRATLIDGRNEKYFVQSSTTDSDTNETSTSFEERNQFLGLQFSASAQVGDPGEPHTVSLQIPITSLVDRVDIPGSGGAQAPVASTRMIDQQVRVRDGEIKVIGGLTKTIAVDRESGIPIFREIPVAGKLGNQENLTYENVEFVVLLQVKRLD